MSDQKDASRECVRNIFLVANINIARTIPSDRMLVQALLEELERRDKIGRTTREGKIAIVSEWDTLYGRSLPLEFRREICFERTDPDCPSPMKALQHFVDHPDQDEKSGILRYTYFRGLDGVVSGRNQEQTTSKGNDKKPPTLNDALRSVELGAKEPPIGESQLDSMRRLANVIREQDKREKDNCWWFEKIIGKCLGITAIGVTGSDVYDKFLVLQALRQRLPEKVFFTTDLDARYTEPEQIKWTRNLIVASHFGLQLEEHIQRDVPPEEAPVGWTA